MTKHDDDDDLDLDLDLDLSLDELELDEIPADEPATKPAEEAAATTSDAGETAPAEPTAADTPVETVAVGVAMGAAATSESPATTSTPEPTPERAVVTATPAADTTAAASGHVEGQWVWQYAAPPPPPSFGAMFFSGRALGELYRFFACGLMVFIGCLLPWGKSMEWVVEHGESTLAYAPPAGYELTAGAVSMALALWLMGVSCYGIYSGRQKILPVFLMLFPAWFTWGRMMDAWELVADLGFKEKIARVSEVAGTGVMLAMLGSTIVAVQLLLVVLKVMKKQPAPEGGGRTRKAKESKPKKEKPAKAKKADKKDAGKDKDKDKSKSKDKSKDAAAGDAAGKDDDGKGRSSSRRRGRKR